MIFMQSETKTIRAGLLAMALLVLVSACASQGDTADESGTAMTAVANTDTAAAVEAENEAKKRLVCRTIKPTGSRFGEKICMFPEQWEKYAGHGRRTLEGVQERALTTNDQGG